MLSEEKTGERGERTGIGEMLILERGASGVECGFIIIH